MKPILFTFLLAAALAPADARDFGVSTSSYGRGTKIETNRGGTAYVGPRGVAGETAGGNQYAAGRRGAAVSTDSGAYAARRYPVAPVAPAVRPVVPVAPVVAPLPAGYIRTIPVGGTTVVYGGYNCVFVGGVYYRPVIYGGSTVYVIVR